MSSEREKSVHKTFFREISQSGFKTTKQLGSNEWIVPILKAQQSEDWLIWAKNKEGCDYFGKMEHTRFDKMNLGNFHFLA